MSLQRQRALNVCASIVLPPLLLALLFFTAREISPVLLQLFGVWWQVIVLLPGFFFVAREFRLYALAIAPVYFPAMYWVTVWGSFYVLLGLYASLYMFGIDLGPIDF